MYYDVSALRVKIQGNGKVKGDRMNKMKIKRREGDK